MTFKDFPLWLEGVFDANPNGLGSEQVELIRAKMKTLTFPKEPIIPKLGINTPVARC